jgi:hypothetical protein
VDINRAWKTIRENIDVSAKESTLLLKHKPWFDERCLKLIDKRNKPNCNGYMIQEK